MLEYINIIAMIFVSYQLIGVLIGIRIILNPIKINKIHTEIRKKYNFKGFCLGFHTGVELILYWPYYSYRLIVGSL